MPRRVAILPHLKPLIEQRYAAGESSVAIGRDLGINAATICDYLDRRGIARRSLREANQRHVLAERYFQRIDTSERAYWLGFLAADGGNRSRTLTLTLQERDREHVERFRAAIASDHPIATDRLAAHSYARLTIHSTALTADLAAHGVTERKTMTLRWPNLPRPFLSHYLRGYMDGDGGFYVGRSVRHGYPLPSFALTSNLGFLDGCQRYLMEECGLPATRHNISARNPQIGALRYGGRQQVIRIFELVYRDATVWLPRKREKIEPVISVLPTEYLRRAG